MPGMPTPISTRRILLLKTAPPSARERPSSLHRSFKRKSKAKLPGQSSYRHSQRRAPPTATSTTMPSRQLQVLSTKSKASRVIMIPSIESHRRRTLPAANSIMASLSTTIWRPTSPTAPPPRVKSTVPQARPLLLRWTRARMFLEEVCKSKMSSTWPTAGRTLALATSLSET